MSLNQTRPFKGWLGPGKANRSLSTITTTTPTTTTKNSWWAWVRGRNLDLPLEEENLSDGHHAESTTTRSSTLSEELDSSTSLSASTPGPPWYNRLFWGQKLSLLVWLVFSCFAHMLKAAKELSMVRVRSAAAASGQAPNGPQPTVGPVHTPPPTTRRSLAQSTSGSPSTRSTANRQWAPPPSPPAREKASQTTGQVPTSAIPPSPAVPPRAEKSHQEGEERGTSQMEIRNRVTEVF